MDKAVVCPLSLRRYAQCKLCRRRGFHSAVLGWSSTCSLVCKRQGFGQTVEKTVVPQLPSSDKVVTVPGVRVAQILRCKCGGDSRLPQLQLLRIPSRFRACSWTMSLTCLCCATDRCLVSGCRKLRILRSCSSSTRCGRPCDYAATCLAVGGATDSVHRLISWTPSLHRDRLQLGTWL